MFEKVQNSILFFLKNIQFGLRTWRNAVEISRAYARPSNMMARIEKRTQEKRRPLIAIVVVVLIIGTGSAGYFWLSKGKPITVKKEVVEKKVSTTNIQQKPLIEPEKSIVDEREEINTPQSIEEPVFQDTLPKISKPDIKKYNLQPVSDTNAFFVLVANKAIRSLYVLQKQNVWRVVREYSIAIGAQEGRKQTAGDRRTPEGSYFIVGRKERSELNIIYGPLAYVLNYPNVEDEREGRTGQGIWIHGTDPDSLPFETLGCLEMNNGDLLDLSKLLKRGIGTPITIVYDENMTDPVLVPDFSQIEAQRKAIVEDHHKKVAEFNKFVLGWKTAWESKKILEYETYYDTALFKAQGMLWTDWKERKLRTFSLYDTIAISVSHLMVTDVDENTSVIKFMQHYKTNLNNIENGKKLNLEKVNGFWKITGESTCPKEELLL